MKYLVVFALGVFVTHAFSVSERRIPELSSIPTNSRIIGGQPAVNGQFPYMAYLTVGCGGSLIHERWVITAAHCVQSLRPQIVYLGNVKALSSTVQEPTIKIHIHPLWNPIAAEAVDLALLELGNPITFTENIKPIRIPSSPNDSFAGEVALHAGFGYINDYDDSPDVLQYVKLEVMTDGECKNVETIFKEYFHMCAKGIDSPSQGSCYGDSGSGLILRRPDGDILIGVSSFLGSTQCEGPYHSGFDRVYLFLDWIRETTGLDF